MGQVTEAMKKLLLYAALGLVGTIVQYAVLITLVQAFFFSPSTGSAIGAAAGAIVNYQLNAVYNFKHTGDRFPALLKFLVTAGIGMGANWLVMLLLTSHLHLNYLLSQVLATGVVLGLTFLINSTWTFKRPTTS